MPKRELFLISVLELAATEGWRWVTISKIASLTGQDKTAIDKVFTSKNEILKYLIEYVSETVKAKVEVFEGDKARDVLFDLIMARFDILTPHKKALTSILSYIDPCAFSLLAIETKKAMKMMLDIAGISTSGLIGSIRVKVLAIVYTNTFRAWLKDKSSTSERTMIVLEEGLSKAETLSHTLWVSNNIPDSTGERAGT